HKRLPAGNGIDCIHVAIARSGQGTPITACGWPNGELQFQISLFAQTDISAPSDYTHFFGAALRIQSDLPSRLNVELIAN
ncbi:MAG: hypothetical protein ABW151_10260, partial [Pseudorhodoplanes sp.]